MGDFDRCDLWPLRRFYLIVPFAEYYTDPFQNLARPLTGGVGYDLIDRPKLEWNITAGPAWDRTAKPKVGVDGVQPKPDDFRLVVGLGVDF
jgi:hypothetical protein